jgi:saccharopine dehydrogenase-like NADP-dependent oxidoreductase
MKIVLLGAGKSAGFLIDYLAHWAEGKAITLVICDQNTQHLSKLHKQHSSIEWVDGNLSDAEFRKTLIHDAFLTISMLPAFMHPIIAEECVAAKSHFASASYESDAMRNLKQAILDKGLIFINECGLDPGIDHMSAMRIIHQLQDNGFEIEAFYSYCGGLVAPDSRGSNPWSYKFSWNPRNVILAGQGTARYLKDGQVKYLPYHRLFAEARNVSIESETYEGYANRDSMGYAEIYGVPNIKTLLRGTLRNKNFCAAWNVFIQLGLTDDTYSYPVSSNTTYFDFLHSFLNHGHQQLMEMCNGKQEVLSMIEWTGLLSDKIIPSHLGSPASILQHLLEEKWKLESSDKDLVVMQHQIEAKRGRERKTIYSSLYLEGELNGKTAMAKTVGLPLAIAVRLIAEGKINETGLHIPIKPTFYEPILDELESNFGVRFKEKEVLN